MLPRHPGDCRQLCQPECPQYCPVEPSEGLKHVLHPFVHHRFQYILMQVHLGAKGKPRKNWIFYILKIFVILIQNNSN